MRTIVKDNSVQKVKKTYLCVRRPNKGDFTIGNRYAFKFKAALGERTVIAVTDNKGKEIEFDSTLEWFVVIKPPAEIPKGLSKIVF